MKKSSVLLLAGAIVLASSSALIARSLMRPPPPVTIVKEVPTATPKTKHVLVAAQDIQPGEFLNGSVLQWKDIPIDDMRSGYIESASISDYYGTTVKREIAADAPIQQDALVKPGEPGFLAAVLRPGTRAISVPTSAVASNAGLVSAGDHVDVILGLDRDASLVPPQPNQPPLLAAQTILRDVRVLALGNEANSIAPISTDNKKTPPANRERFNTITLEVTPPQAEKLAVAKEVGTLQIALRRTDDHDETLPTSGDNTVTRLRDTTTIFAASAVKKSQAVSVTTYKGNQSAQVSFGSSD